MPKPATAASVSLVIETVAETPRMSSSARTLGTLILAALFLGCAESSLSGGAAEVPPGTVGEEVNACRDGLSWQQLLAAIPAGAIKRVEPMYMRDTCAGSAQVSGTRLVLLPKAFSSAQWGTLVTCRGSHVRLSDDEQGPGAISAWIPEGWVDLTVERDHNGVTLALSAESVPKNILLLRRAKAFVREGKE